MMTAMEAATANANNGKANEEEETQILVCQRPRLLIVEVARMVYQQGRLVSDLLVAVSRQHQLLMAEPQAHLVLASMNDTSNNSPNNEPNAATHDIPPSQSRLQLSGAEETVTSDTTSTAQNPRGKPEGGAREDRLKDVEDQDINWWAQKILGSHRGGESGLSLCRYR